MWVSGGSSHAHASVGMAPRLGRAAERPPSAFPRRTVGTRRAIAGWGAVSRPRPDWTGGFLRHPGDLTVGFRRGRRPPPNNGKDRGAAAQYVTTRSVVTRRSGRPFWQPRAVLSTVSVQSRYSSRSHQGDSGAARCSEGRIELPHELHNLFPDKHIGCCTAVRGLPAAKCPSLGHVSCDCNGLREEDGPPAVGENRKNFPRRSKSGTMWKSRAALPSWGVSDALFSASA
jgi:hypothetical protein